MVNKISYDSKRSESPLQQLTSDAVIEVLAELVCIAIRSKNIMLLVSLSLF